MASVLLAEPSAPVAGVLRRYLEGAGHEVSSVGTVDEALRAVRERPPAVLLAAGMGPLDGEALCRGLRAQGASPPVLLVYPPDEEHADQRAAEAGADGCLVGPLKRANVLTCVALVVQREEARRQATAASKAPPAASTVTPSPGTLPAVEPEGRRITRPELPAAGASPDFEFLKRLMLMEVKRSRRYRYPIALLLLELDGFVERTAALAPAGRTAVLAEALGLLVSGVRDIDVAVPFADSRFVVFLPHTPRSGALVVAERLRERVGGLRGLSGASASVGVAVSEPPGGKGTPSGSQAQVSFGSLLKEAGEALRRAQAAGGDRVEPAGGGRPQPG